MIVNTFSAILTTALVAFTSSATATSQSCIWTPVANKPSNLQCGVQGQVKNPQLISTWTVKGGSWTDCREGCREDRNCAYYSYYKPSSECRTYRGTIVGAGLTKGNTGTTYWNHACYNAKCETVMDVSKLNYQNSILQVHNVHRANHSVGDLTWSNTMANYAQQIAATCTYAHSRAAGDGNYGQNIAAGVNSAQAAGLISNAMYNDEFSYYPKPYGQDNPDMSNFEAWGHYSQIVWASTTQVGCYTQYCPNGLANVGSNIAPYFTVCNYFPPGNFIGQFSQVKAPKGGQSITVTP